MSFTGEWDWHSGSVVISLTGLNAPRIILTVALPNASREVIELSQVITDSAGAEMEAPVASWGNCLPTRSFATPLGPPAIAGGGLVYRVRATRFSGMCGNSLGNAAALSEPRKTADPTDKVARWSWDFGIGDNSTEKAYIAIMVVDNNVGGG